MVLIHQCLLLPTSFMKSFALLASLRSAIQQQNLGLLSYLISEVCLCCLVIQGSLLRVRSFHLRASSEQGNRPLAARYLQRAAMAGEAASAQAEADDKSLLAPIALQETVLAAFSAHVQTEMSPGTNQQGWKQAEVHLESVRSPSFGLSKVQMPPSL